MRDTTRVFNLVHLIVGFSWVRLYARYVLEPRTHGGQSITSSRSRRTRTLLSPYVNELLIFRASGFFFFFFFFTFFVGSRPGRRGFIISPVSSRPRRPPFSRAHVQAMFAPLQSGN